ncbi:hypothetical protein [Lacisediminimonas sp.]|uniref:hypothetical protein n=1 Tax=Lacisediminimonas sp. TaxID=3060582 RepID=UPI0027207064|nr:hypothetical protein [Lacisediminimonas sp.]MDO8298373.1 hypothetical protein [Lacisediminimonas sp.]
MFKPLKKSLAGTSKRKPDLPVKTGAATALKARDLKEGLSHPRQSSPAKSSGSVLERRFVNKEGLWQNDRESMLSAISAQFARHGAKDALPVNVNGRSMMLSGSMVLEQLQLFVSTSPASGPAPSSLPPLMHASLQLWQDASRAATDGKRQPPFMRELNDKVDDGIKAAGKYPLNIIPSKVGKIAAKPIMADTEPVAVPVPPPPRALARRFERTAEGARRKADVQHGKPLQVKTRQAEPQQEPLPFHPSLLKLGAMIDMRQAPDDITLLSLVRGAQDDKAIAAVPVEGERLLLMKVSREPQFEEGIKLAARKINEHPSLAGKCATDCVSVRDLRALLEAHL